MGIISGGLLDHKNAMEEFHSLASRREEYTHNMERLHDLMNNANKMGRSAAMQGFDKNVPLQPELYDVSSGTQYPFWFFNMLMLVAVFATLLGHLFTKSSEQFSNVTFDHNRAVVAHIVMCIVLTVALVFASKGGWELLLVGYENLTEMQTNSLTLGVTLVVVAYIFEMVYRPKMGTSGFLHRFMAVIFFQLILLDMYTAEDFGVLAHIRAATPIVFTAVIDQGYLCGMFLFRTEYYEAALKVFQWTNMPTLLLKIGLTLWAILLKVSIDSDSETGDSTESFLSQSLFKFLFYPYVVILLAFQTRLHLLLTGLTRVIEGEAMAIETEKLGSTFKSNATADVIRA